ncbi:MAG: Cdc6-like AAA superfamily ATPase [Flavobacteriaceae bacterium]|jgi:Cdc6-like AAA superfamily ATPase
MSNIPNNINKEHIISAIQDIENNGISNSRRNATEYALIYKDNEYPPKYVISIANRYVNNEELSSNDFNSIQSRTFLNKLGFNCVKKTGSIKNDFAKWLLKNGANSYKDYYGNSIEEIEDKLVEINSFFERDIFKLDNNIQELKSFLNENIYGENREKNSAFFEYDKLKGNGRPKAILGRKNYFVFLDKYSLNNPSLLQTQTMDTINITGYKIYKISMGSFLKDKNLVNIDPVEHFEKNNLIVMFKDTAYNQGNDFANKMKIGDFIYLTYGQQRLSFVAKVISDVNPINSLMDIDLNDDWFYRKVAVIKHPVINNTYDLKDKTGWLPSGYSTFKEITNLNQANKLLFNKYFKINIINDDLENSNQVKEQTIKHTALNQILYGPPGTGKTYKTKEIAVQISNPNFIYDINWSIIERREEIVKEYDRLCEKGQIVFTTFHQSMSYEDFVEGIKPKTVKTKITYDVEDGVFKILSDKAKDNWEANNKRFEKELAFDSVFSKLREEWEEDDSIKFPMKTDGNDFTIIGFTNKSIQFKKASGGTSHTLSINTLRNIFYDESKNRTTGVGIYYPPILAHLKKYKTQTDIPVTLNNYVLIIDEINRGNVSAVFGELITLLEDDKRIGQKEAIKITLPYSKDEFGVPSNLYIIGTMNTADRSVEALDTALRRRFSFTEVAPNSELLEDKEVEEEIDLKKLLQTINDRIELLIDKDHKIGHSYFMNIADLSGLKQTFKNKVIPLLEEYFFGDYGKIGLVLGDGFIKLKDGKDKIYFAKNFTEKYEDAENLREKAVYTFTDEDSWDKSAFISIYEQ